MLFCCKEGSIEFSRGLLSVCQTTLDCLQGSFQLLWGSLEGTKSSFDCM